MLLKPHQPRHRTVRRRGSTLAEAAVTLFLMVLLGMLMAATVATFARPSADVEHRARLALEANLAVEALTYDLGGYLADGASPAGTLEKSQVVRQTDQDPLARSWTFGSENGSLNLTFTSPDSPDRTVVYQREGDQLTRTVISTSSSTVVAGHVADFRAYPCEADGTVSGTGTYARIVLTLAHDPSDPAAESKGNCTATYVLIAVPPP